MTGRPKHREKPVKRVNPSGKTVWKARYTAPDGSRPSAGTFRLQGDAQDAIDAAYDAAYGPVSTEPAASTVAGYLPRWLDEHAVSERTMRTNRGRINALLLAELEGVAFGDWEMADVGRRQAKDLVALMFNEQKRSPGGVRNHLAALSAMFTAAIADDLCEMNPWKDITVRDDDKRACKQNRKPRIWSWEEMHEFASFAGPYEPMIRTMSDCGLRVGECFALRRSGLLVSERILQVRGSAWEGTIVPSSREKNHDRDVPIPDELLSMLVAMPRMLHSDWLFGTPGWRVASNRATGRFEPASGAGLGAGAGKLWRYSNWCRRVWAPTIDRANEKPRDRRLDPVPGDLRHSWVSHVRDEGINPAAVAAVAGHTVETESRVYTKRVQDRFEEIRQAVGSR
jgi:integrase